MSSWPASDSPGATVPLSAPELQAGHTLTSNSAVYSVLEFIGEGCFGKVARCQNVATKEVVAVKVLKKKDYHRDTENEVFMLKVINLLNPDRFNIVKFFERFEHLGQKCLAFEMLDGSLYDLLQKQAWQPLPLKELRPIAKQLLVALDTLKDLGILHTDIKPDNIMCVNRRNQPLRVKLIDFGEAILASEVQTGMQIQATGYRAPEVALGLPFTEAIDVWGVGCVLAFLYLSNHLFRVDCKYQMMKSMVEALGQPEDHMLRAGKYTRFFFREDEAVDPPAWRLMTPKEFIAANNIKPKKENDFIESCSLDDLLDVYPLQKAVEVEDRMAFVDLMKQLLHLDGDQRISPYEALQHPFITMSHLNQRPYTCAYVTTSRKLMNMCQSETSADQLNTAAACKPEQNGPPVKSAGRPGVPVFNDDGPTIGPFDGDKETSSYYTDPPIWSCNGGLPLISHDEVSAPWTSDGERPPFFYDEDPAVQSSDEELCSYDEDPFLWSFDREQPPHSDDEDQAARSSDGGTQIASTARASASSGRTRKLLRRIQTFFRSLCCCGRLTVED